MSNICLPEIILKIIKYLDIDNSIKYLMTIEKLIDYDKDNINYIEISHDIEFN